LNENQSHVNRINHKLATAVATANYPLPVITPTKSAFTTAATVIDTAINVSVAQITNGRCNGNQPRRWKPLQQLPLRLK
jgi:hypothetical protein